VRPASFLYCNQLSSFEDCEQEEIKTITKIASIVLRKGRIIVLIEIDLAGIIIASK
jgi:hypothetical protein